MRLSEHERRVLAEPEESLMASDRRFVRRFGQRSGSALRPPGPARCPHGRLRRTLSVLVHWWA